MTDDFSELLDSSFGEGPVPAPAADRLAPARQALRRRRLLSGGGAALGVAAAVTAVALLSGGSGGGTQAVQPAAGPDVTTPSAEAIPDGLCEGSPDLGRSAFPAPADGLPAVPEGLEVDPATGQLSIPVAPGAETGVPADPAPDDTGTTYVGSCEAIPSETEVGQITSPDEPVAPGETLDPAATNTSAPDDTLVRFAGATGDELVALDGVTLVGQSGDVDLEDYAAPGERSAVAKVTTSDGTTVYVLARESDYIATYDVAGLWPTIADFMAYATDKYAGGEGLL